MATGPADGGEDRQGDVVPSVTPQQPAAGEAIPEGEGRNRPVPRSQDRAPQDCAGGPVPRSRAEEVVTQLHAEADLEWLPQELVLFNGGLYEQKMRVELASQASFLYSEIVRLGRTAAGETLTEGCWRTS